MLIHVGRLSHLLARQIDRKFFVFEIGLAEHGGG